MKLGRILLAVSIFPLTIALLTGCGPKTAQTEGKLSGTITADGSSTVYPITQAVAEEFMAKNPDVKISVGISGTGGGFKKFLAKEIQISDASRPIKQAERDTAKTNGIDYIEIPVAYDGISVVVNPKNTWANDLTVEELKKIWEPDSKINNWKDVRPGFPDKPLKLFGPGTDSGTFDYFTEAINGKEKVCRADYTQSEDDNVIVQGVSGEEGALGYFGYAYYVENKDKLKLIAVNSGSGAIQPSNETIINGTYAPLARPIFIYINKADADKPEINAFVKFYLTEGKALVSEAKYIPLPDKAYEMGLQRFEKKIVGTMFEKGSHIGVKIEDILAKESEQK